MSILFKKYNSVNWDNVVERLKDNRAVKLYFDCSFETLMLCGAGGFVLTKNNILGEVYIHDPLRYATELNADSLQTIIKNNIYGNDIEDIVIIEEVEYELTLVDLSD